MDLKAIGLRVRQRRKELDLTQEQLAARAGISQAAIAKIERGGATRHTAEIARALDASTNWLVYGSDDSAQSEQGYWPFKVARLSEFEKLSPAKQNELDIRLADFIAGASEQSDSKRVA
ncbi:MULTISPECIES: helix-turn-helix domain-containing protein [Achromobacter]|uniref:Helix-turn-helix domain-containing protein n=1 Tax=Achromobacter spanius TaxID=217203 RepID=A0AA42S7T3_9BURK|nr:helix-turn-helix domain-containing protein [Achromobacter spanius]MDH0739901.1 helix-turn-helix domain-containing protein [Achromobacter spanius]